MGKFVLQLIAGVGLLIFGNGISALPWGAVLLHCVVQISKLFVQLGDECVDFVLYLLDSFEESVLLIVGAGDAGSALAHNLVDFVLQGLDFVCEGDELLDVMWLDDVRSAR